MTTKCARLVVFCSAMLLGGIATMTGSGQLVTVRSDSSFHPFRDRVECFK